MSTHPVLLGRVTRLNVGDAPKREDQTGPPGHGDIQASPSPPVTRVRHGDSEDRPSWTWRCVQMFIALLIVIFTTWLAIAPVSEGSWETPHLGVYENEEVAALKDDPSFISLMVSTGLAGLAAIWLYLIAPTAHTLLAASFLCLNWVEGLVTLSSITAMRRTFIMQDGASKRSLVDILATLRVFLLLCEFLGMQFIIQNRLQSLWPALNRPGCKVWLARCMRMEVAIFFLCFLSNFLVQMWVVISASKTKVVNFVGSVTESSAIASTPIFFICFLIWSVLITVTLFRVILTFHKALQGARQQGLSVAATFQACRGRSSLQFTGVIISLATTLVTAYVLGTSMAVSSKSFDLRWVAIQCSNLLVNAAGIILLSGASSLITSKGTLRFPPLRCCRCPWRFRRSSHGFQFFNSLSSSNLKTDEENDWEKKTRELASRGISLGELIAFYKSLGDTVMQSFQASVHTTNDVVRLAIIPMTASSCCSYAQLVNKGEKILPKKMITHNWSNLFRDLLASVISDALGEHTFEFIAELLSDKAGVEALEEMLQVHGSLQETYWICAFAVNQHAGICGANPAGTVDPVTGLPHPTCQCSEPKFFNEDPPLNDDGKSIQCEMNKFDDMMALLARENPDFAEVVAVDASLDLFGRAWCVAELAEAHRMGMAQSLKMRNEETLLRRQLTLQGLKVENMKASRPEDVVEILGKIPDKDAFNSKLQELIFDSNVGLVAAWKNADALWQMEEASHVLKWLRLSEAVEGGQLVWQRWLP